MVRLGEPLTWRVLGFLSVSATYESLCFEELISSPGSQRVEATPADGPLHLVLGSSHFPLSHLSGGQSEQFLTPGLLNSVGSILFTPDRFFHSSSPMFVGLALGAVLQSGPGQGSCKAVRVGSGEGRPSEGTLRPWEPGEEEPAP